MRLGQEEERPQDQIIQQEEKTEEKKQEKEEPKIEPIAMRIPSCVVGRYGYAPVNATVKYVSVDTDKLKLVADEQSQDFEEFEKLVEGVQEVLKENSDWVLLLKKAEGAEKNNKKLLEKLEESEFGFNVWTLRDCDLLAIMQYREEKEYKIRICVKIDGE